MTKGGRRAPEASWRQGGGGRSSPRPVPETSRPLGRVVRPLARWTPRASPIGRPPREARGHGGGRAVGGRQAGGPADGQRAAGAARGGMAGAGLRATARRWLLCRGHGGPRAASSSPSCPGCGPPGPGAHCPSTPRSAPADGADLSAHLWARYQDMRRLVHGG